MILVESHPLFVCLAGGWLKRIKRAPVVLNVSDLWPESAVATGGLSADSKLVKIAAQVERWTYQDAAHIVGMTEGVVQGIIQISGHPERVTLSRNAVDLAQFCPGQEAEGLAMRKRLGLIDRFVVGHIGNMSLAHDFDLLLEVAAALPEFTFVFAGGGSRAPYLTQQIQFRQLANVVLPGILPHHDMPALWAATDVCLISFKDHPLFDGALPSKMLEAMAMGVPVVAAARGETPGVLSRTGAGIAVPIGDQAAMMNALRQLASSPELRRTMGRAGRIYAETNLSPERVKRTIVSIFEKVVLGSSQVV